MKIETITQTIEFTVEQTETLTIRRSRKIEASWCSKCGREAMMSKPDAAARTTGVSTRKIYSGIEAGHTHFAESTDGSLFVCLRSLENQTMPKLYEGELDQP